MQHFLTHSESYTKTSVFNCRKYHLGVTNEWTNRWNVTNLVKENFIGKAKKMLVSIETWNRRAYLCKRLHKHVIIFRMKTQIIFVEGGEILFPHTIFLPCNYKWKCIVRTRIFG